MPPAPPCAPPPAQAAVSIAASSLYSAIQRSFQFEENPPVAAREIAHARTESASQRCPFLVQMLWASDKEMADPRTTQVRNPIRSARSPQHARPRSKLSETAGRAAAGAARRRNRRRGCWTEEGFFGWQEIFQARNKPRKFIGALQKAEIEKWWSVIKAAGIKAE